MTCTTKSNSIWMTFANWRWTQSTSWLDMMKHVHHLFSQKLKANLQQTLTFGVYCVYLGMQTPVSTVISTLSQPKKKNSPSGPGGWAGAPPWCGMHWNLVAHQSRRSGTSPLSLTLITEPRFEQTWSLAHLSKRCRDVETKADLWANCFYGYLWDVSGNIQK